MAAAAGKTTSKDFEAKAMTMNLEHFQWVIGGIAGLATVLLGAIWSELRLLREGFDVLGKSDATTKARVDSLEERVGQLPCLDPRCPK